MTYKHSLAHRGSVGSSLMGITISCTYVALMYGQIQEFVNSRVADRVEHEIRIYHEAYQKDKNVRLPHLSDLNTYIGAEQLPENLKEPLAGLEGGVYRPGKNGIVGIEGYVVAVDKLPDTNEKVFIVVRNNKHSDFDKKRLRAMMFILIQIAIIVIVLGIGIAFLLSRRVIAPIVQLVGTVEKAGPDHLSADIAGAYYNDEVGALAQAFEDAMNRIKEFVERERMFTRDASHELRSPLTVIKGALALLKLKTDSFDEKSTEVIKRIERAVASMEATVDCFLWMAREESGIGPATSFFVAAVIEHELEPCRFIMENRAVEVEILKSADPEITAPVHAFSIAVSNLIRNALKYTERGYVKITIHENRVEISDTGIGMEPDKVSLMQEVHQKSENSTGFGLGLSIVKRLCDTFGWRLTIDSEIGKGTTVKFYFL